MKFKGKRCHILSVMLIKMSLTARLDFFYRLAVLYNLHAVEVGHHGFHGNGGKWVSATPKKFELF